MALAPLHIHVHIHIHHHIPLTISFGNIVSNILVC